MNTAIYHLILTFFLRSSSPLHPPPTQETLKSQDLINMCSKLRNFERRYVCVIKHFDAGTTMLRLGAELCHTSFLLRQP